MWMHQPLLHTVAVPNGAAIQIPADRCCNCGVAEGVAYEKVKLRRTIYVGIGGFEQRLQLALPACPICKWTMFRPAPGLLKRIFYALLWSFFGWMGVMWVLLLQLNVTPPFGLGVGGVWAVCAVVALAAAGGWYATRRPQGTQTSYYQPVRLLGAVSRKDNGRVLTWTLLGFTQGSVAAATVEAIPGAQLHGAAPVAQALRPR